MGLLDDAIKEHLDLKRRRGADPSEIARQETEALGPVRRGEVDLAERPLPADAPDDVAADEAPVLDDSADPAPAEPTPAAHDVGGPQGDPLGDEALGQTRQFSAAEVEAALAADPDVVAGDADGEPDVLEETPEFLEETPEHDRLWFEQKPPKDFDF